MKVPIALVLLARLAMCSLEPTNYRVPSSHYLPLHQFSRGSATYSAPSPSNHYIPAPVLSEDFTPPEVADVRSGSSFPSTSYGVPDYSSVRSNQGDSTAHQGHAAHQDYSARESHQGESFEPARYKFGYEVKDDNGNDYSHQESRDGSKTRGAYSVLLPDGRRQIVEYEADEHGYRPRISYEDASSSLRYNQRPSGNAQTAYPGAPY